jgi:hypothetical protein
VQLLIALADFLCSFRKVNSATLAFFLIHTPTGSPAIVGNYEGQTQLMRNKNKLKTDSDWSETFGKWQMNSSHFAGQM